MANNFNWSASSWAEIAAELKRRDVSRRLSKDSNLICGGCGKKPKRHEICFYPANGLGRENKIIGHEACVNAKSAHVVAKETGARAAAHTVTNAEIIKRKLQDRIPNAENLDKTLRPVDIKHKFDEWRKVEYERGYNDAWREIEAILDATP